MTLSEITKESLEGDKIVTRMNEGPYEMSRNGYWIDPDSGQYVIFGKTELIRGDWKFHYRPKRCPECGHVIP